MTTCSAIVGANSSRAAASAAGVPQVDEDHVAAGQQLGVRAEHRVHRGDLAAVGLQRHAVPRAAGSSASRRRRPPRGGRRSARSRRIASVTPSGVATTMKSCSRSVRAPVLHAVHAPGTVPRVGDLDREALRAQEVHEPAAHLAGAADHQRAPAAAGAARRPRSPAPGSSSEERISRRSSCSASAGRHPALGGHRAHAQDHVALALVVARRACRWRA